MATTASGQVRIPSQGNESGDSGRSQGDTEVSRPGRAQGGDPNPSLPEACCPVLDRCNPRHCDGGSLNEAVPRHPKAVPATPAPLLPTPVPLCRVLLCPNSVQMQARGAACHPRTQYPQQ